MEITLNWSKDLEFQAQNCNGARLGLDGQSQNGLSPMEALLSSLCGCMGIDVVDILKKMRARIDHFSVKATSQRKEQPPRYFTDIQLDFRIQTDAAPERVERAIGLSFEKYCSVFHTLRKDLKVSHRLILDS